MVGVFNFEFNLVSCIVTIEGLVDCMSWVSSIVLLRMPLILSWSILGFFSLGCVGFGLWGRRIR